jgi:hypothetical protein
MRPLVRLLDVFRPGRYASGPGRLILLCLFLVVVGMLRPRFSPHDAGWLLVGGGLAVALGALGFLLATRRIALRLPAAERSHRVARAALVTVRQTGLPFLALGFFVLWTFVYIGLWWFNPEQAFRGLDERPRFADFFYYAVTTALTSPPEEIVPLTRGARTASMIEMLTGLSLLATYVTSLVDFRFGGRRPRDEHAGAPLGPRP